MTPSHNLEETTQIKIDPEVIDFGIGQPQLETLPRELLWNAVQRTLSQIDNTSLNYGHPKGDLRFRTALSSYLTPTYGQTVQPGSLLATAGASQALDLVAGTFAKPGDTVLVEEPTYFLAHQIFRDRGLKIVSVPLAPDGVDLEVLVKLVKKHKPAFFYTIPIFQNPTGISTSLEKKRELVVLAQNYGFLLVADEVYQLLYYSKFPTPPLANFIDSEAVISIGSFSKILAPGLRLGWVQTCSTHQEKLLESGLLKSGGGLNHFACCAVGQAIESGLQANYTEQLRRLYAHRVEVMDRCLKDRLGAQVSYQKPEGGYFFWLQLADEVDAEELSERAARFKTGFRSGIRFSNQGQWRNYIRLSFAHYSENAIEVGIDRLTRTLQP